MKNTPFFFFVLLTFLANSSNAQTISDSALLKKDFFTIEDALKNPAKVYRLTLDSSSLRIPDSIWTKFSNLEYLSLKNDHLPQIPPGVGLLANLKVLDLSGNDFKTLPSSFSKLQNLQELYINDDKKFQLGKNISTLSKLKNLKSLHLENDNLKGLPANISRLSHLELLYLNNNHFKKVPSEIKGIKNLKFVELHDNDIVPDVHQKQNTGFGVKIGF